MRSFKHPKSEYDVSGIVTSTIPGENSLLQQSTGLRVTHFASNHSAAGREPFNRVREFHFYSISHLLEGTGWFWLEGDKEITTIEAGSAIVITPGMRFDYGGLNCNYTEDFLCFTGATADVLRDEGILKGGIYKIGDSRPLTDIIESALQPDLNSQLITNTKLQQFLINLNTRYRGAAPSADRLSELISDINSEISHWWSVNDMAEFCNMGLTKFRAKFKAKTGMLPKHYIEQVKIRKAAEMLLNSRESIVVIAEIFGYHDEYHFSKRFKSVMNLPPGKYRSLYQQQ